MKNYSISPLPLRTRLAVQKIVEKIPFAYRDKLLVVGVGDGSETASLVNIFKKIKGIDFSSRAVKLAKQNTKKYANVFICKQDLTQTGGLFSTCLMVAVLEHIENDLLALRKINSLLTEKGYLLLGVPAHRNLYNIHDRRVGHFRRYEKNELKIKLNKCGFAIKSFETIGFPVGNVLYFVYNLLLRFLGKDMLREKQSMVEKTKKTAPGVEEKMVKGLHFLNWTTPLMVNLMKFFDQFFLNTDMGLYYVVLARKK